MRPNDSIDDRAPPDSPPSQDPTSTAPLDHELRDFFADRLGREATELGHPEPELLVAYLEGDLPAAEILEIQAHAEQCRPCLDTLLELDELRRTDPPPADGVVDFERAAAWRELCRRLGAPIPSISLQKADPEPATTARRPRHGLRHLGRTIPRLAAAVFLLTTTFFGLRSAELERRLSTPRADVPLAYLEFTRDAQTTTLAPPDDGFAFLFVNLPDPDPTARYAVELLTTDGVVVWSAQATNDHGALRLALPDGFVDSGSYRLRVLDAQHELVIEHRLDVQ